MTRLRTSIAAGMPVQPSSSLAILGLSLAMLMASLDTGIANAGLPELAHTFGATFPQVQWIVLAYLLAVTVSIVSFGRLGDAIGRKKLLLIGLGTFTGASILCGVTSGVWPLAMARAAQGTGAAMMLALSFAVVGETVPRERAGRAMGLLSTMSAIGTALGPTAGGFLVGQFGWRSMFLVNVPIGLLAIWVLSRNLPESSRSIADRMLRVDWAGTALLAGTLGAFVLAITSGHDGFTLRQATLLSLAAVSLWLFVMVEKRHPEPLLPLAALRDLSLSRSLFSGVIVSAVMMSTLIVGPFYLSRSLGLDVSATGLALSVGPVIVALGGVPAGRLADRFGGRRTSVVGVLLMAVGAGMLVPSWTDLSPILYLGPIGLLAAGYALFQTSNTSAVLSGAAEDSRGLISGLLSLSRFVGHLSGTAVLGTVFALASGADSTRGSTATSIATGMHVTFLVAAALLGLAIALSLLAANSAHAPRIGTRRLAGADCR